MKTKIEAWQCVCEKCGVEWQSRTWKVPKMCPGCKSVNWGSSTEKKLPQVVVAKIEAEGVRIASETPSKPVELEADWTGWTPELQTTDAGAGETITYRRHIKTGKRREIKRESAW